VSVLKRPSISAKTVRSMDIPPVFRQLLAFDVLGRQFRIVFPWRPLVAAHLAADRFQERRLTRGTPT
jgi:hypothetical protein